MFALNSNLTSIFNPFLRYHAKSIIYNPVYNLRPLNSTTHYLFIIINV